MKRVLALALLLAGCETSAPEAPLPAPTPADAVAYPIGYSEVGDRTYGEGAPPEASLEVSMESFAATMEAKEALRDAPVTDADRAVREAFAADVSSEARWHMETTLSLRMLDRLLPPGAEPDAAATPERVGYYVERLVRHKNPNADRVLAGLRYLEPHWPDDRVRAAAARAAGAAVPFAGPCEGCRVADEATGVGMSQRREAIAHALPRLERLASGG